MIDPFKFRSKILAALALHFLFGFSQHASAEDLWANDSAAPCGVLKQVGPVATIHNKSNFTFNVRFETAAIQIGPLRSVNAGAVKYLDFDGNNQGVWRDTGEGDDHSIKKYTIRLQANQGVPIAYCADTSNGASRIRGKLYFDPQVGEGEHNIPQSGIDFFSADNHVVIDRDFLFHPYFTPFVDYNVDNLGRISFGSFVLCLRDSYCRIE